MKCANCGAECNSGVRFCDQCGAGLMTLGGGFRVGYPKDAERLLEILRSKLDTDSVRNSPKSINGQIVSIGDVEISGDLSELPKIYSKGKVSISSQKTQNILSLSYLPPGRDRIQIAEAVFSDDAVIRREGDCVSVYTDYGKYCIDDRVLDRMTRRYFSRSSLAVLRKDDLFYVYTDNRKNPQYVRLNDSYLNGTSIGQFGYGYAVLIGGKFEMKIRRT